MNQNFSVALGNAHGRQNVGRRIGANQQINLVDGHQLLVKRTGEIGL